MTNQDPITAANGGDSIYGSFRPRLEEILQEMQNRIADIRAGMKKELGLDPVEHCLGRIKSEESMREKCRRKNLPESPESALFKIHDAIGLRIVCAFVDDIYTIKDALVSMPDITVVEEKDYIRRAKPNGYRSYHMILRVRDEAYAEIQLRTISMDTWAALEHHMRYKKQLSGNQQLIADELKRCADELASTDISMQTIRNMIMEDTES